MKPMDLCSTDSDFEHDMVIGATWTLLGINNLVGFTHTTMSRPYREKQKGLNI